MSSIRKAKVTEETEGSSEESITTPYLPGCTHEYGYKDCHKWLDTYFGNVKTKNVQLLSLTILKSSVNTNKLCENLYMSCM